ncbi:MAG TPA: zinc ribbon domain-containing protein [Blastocatellia bacterium]|nr:zinc ribbon domain-containing protein [Blastocatellia bacterium]
MICPSCGTDNTPDRKYCGLCGQFLAQSSEAAATPPAQPAPAQPLRSTTRDLNPSKADRPPKQLGPTAKLPPRSISSGAAAQPAPIAQQDASVPPEQSLFADAFRYALSWRPLSLLTIGFFCSIMVLFFSTIINSVIIKIMLSGGGSSLETVEVVGVILMVLTLLVCYVIEIIFLSATTKICYERLTSGRALRRAEAMKFAVSNAATVIIAPFLFVLATLVVLFVEYLIFLLGSTEAIGPVVTGIFFPPFVIINALMFFVINYAIWMALITVSSGTRSIGETMSKSMNLVKRSLRTHVPELFSLTLVQILVALFAVVIVATGFVLTMTVAGWGGAEVPVNSIIAGRIARAIERVVIGSPTEASILGPLLGLLTLGGGLALIFGMFLAFPRVFFANGCIRLYQRLVNEAGAPS